MTHEAMYLAATALPIIAGLHRYAVSYGYRGSTRAQALEDAGKVAVVVGTIVAIGLVVHNFIYGW
jgi:hypothetical protein